MSFNRLFEKQPAKSSFKWPVFMLDKSECRPSTGNTFGKFIVLINIKDLPNGLQSNPKLGADDTYFPYFLPYLFSNDVLDKAKAATKTQYFVKYFA